MRRSDKCCSTGLDAALLIALLVGAAACDDDASNSSIATSATSGDAESGSGGIGGDTPEGGAGGSGIGGSGGAGGVGGSPAACNSLPNDGEDIYVEKVPADVPAGEGGAIDDGVYVLTSVAFYTGVGGDTGLQGAIVASKLAIRAGVLEYVYSINEEPEVRATGILTTQDEDLAVDYACPDGVDVSPAGPLLPPGPYTASPTTLILLFPENSWTYARQP